MRLLVVSCQGACAASERTLSHQPMGAENDRSSANQRPRIERTELGPETGQWTSEPPAASSLGHQSVTENTQ